MDSIRGVDTGGPVGANVTPRITFYPAHATDTSWTLTSLDPAIAIIVVAVPPGQQYIQGRAPGNARIVVTSRGTPAVADTFNFGVGPIKVTGISALNQTTTLGTTLTPVLEWTPSTATNKVFTLSTLAPADTDFVRLVPTQPAIYTQIFGKAVGVANVIVTTQDGGFRDTFTVTVGNVKATGITLNLATPRYVDTVLAPTITWVPSNTTIKTFTLSTATPTLVAFPTATTLRGTRPARPSRRSPTRCPCPVRAAPT
jgi:uncharacterized protein YjdB